MLLKVAPLSFAFVLFSYLTAHAQGDSTRVRTWWLAYKIGKSNANVTEFSQWAFGEGLTNISGRSQNTFIGFDILYHRNRMVYGLNYDMELRSFGQTEPYYFSLTLRAGYTLLQRHKFLLKPLVGLGSGFAFVRFENGEPQSIKDLGADYTDPFARASLFVSRLEVMGSYSLGKDKTNKRGFSFHPLLYVTVGITPTLIHGQWFYGETIYDIDSETGSFVGQPIDMPRFYKANWFTGVGIVLSFESRP